MMSAKDFKEKQVVFVNGREKEKFSFQNDNLLIKDENDQTLLQTSCHNLFALYIIGNFVITTPLIEKSKKFGFSIVLMTYSFRPIETINNGLVGNSLLHKKQYQYYEIQIGKNIILNKVDNQILELKHQRKKTKEMKETIENMVYYRNLFAEKDVVDFYLIMSYEGQIAKQYFKQMFLDLDWKGRKPRTKIDPLNTVLDIGYTILFHYMESLLALFDFDAYIGVFHKQFYKRKSLVCDLVEPFRVIIDHEVLKAFNLKKFKYDDFIVRQDQYILQIKLTSIYVNVFLRAINHYKMDMFYYVQNYYRAFMKNKDISDYPIFRWD